ncbi:MAG TPA: RIO1 family regulatory kinase/ATPase [Trueperaceae bacterium]|nr:RIO1 family regulatory kinase/ATPase [Trueperaceae bacterium]
MTDGDKGKKRADGKRPAKQRPAKPRAHDDHDGHFGVSVRARDLPDKAEVKRTKRKPRAKRTAADLVKTSESGAQSFSDKDLRRLHARGYFDTFVGLVKGGKEATVYLVMRGETPLAAKVYADLESRSFRNDAPYWEALKFEDERLARALKRKSRAGRQAQIALWVMREYANLWRLHDAGVRVPVPALPAEPSAWSSAGAVVLMEFIGTGDDPAPRVADVRLEPAQAQAAYEQAVEIAVSLARLGLVHGDLSTYNLLWHEGEVVLIDLPQVMDVRVGRAASELLARDLNSLAATFEALGATVDVDDLRSRVEDALPDLPPEE